MSTEDEADTMPLYVIANPPSNPNQALRQRRYEGTTGTALGQNNPVIDHYVSVNDQTLQPLNAAGRPGLQDPGFHWGTEGAGPRKLAEAILYDLLGPKQINPNDPSHSPWYQSLAGAFADEKIRSLPEGEPFALSAYDVAEWVQSHV